LLGKDLGKLRANSPLQVKSMLDGRRYRGAKLRKEKDDIINRALRTHALHGGLRSGMEKYGK